MQRMSNKQSDEGSTMSTCQGFFDGPSWWVPYGTENLHIPCSKRLDLDTKSSLPKIHNSKHLKDHIQDQDDSSSQSTGQSHYEVAGCIEINDQAEGLSKHLSSASPGFLFQVPQMDHSQSLAHNHYPYVDPCFGGLVTAYGQQIPALAYGVQEMRVPLPSLFFDIAESPPMYVNAKQYHGIIRRRRSRAKQQAQCNLIKARKPYLHESRHIHALKRARGSGGRFLNTKKLQANEAALDNGKSATDEVSPQHGGNLCALGIMSDNGSEGVSSAITELTEMCGGKHDGVLDLGYTKMSPSC